jgi:hypothetical protein
LPTRDETAGEIDRRGSGALVVIIISISIRHQIALVGPRWSLGDERPVNVVVPAAEAAASETP